MVNRLSTAINRIHPLLWQFACLLVSITAFSLILLNRSPNFLRPLSISLRTGFGLVIPATTLIVYLAFRTPGRFGGLIDLTVVMSLFAMPLAGLWASGQTQTTVLSGLIPLYDAQYYYIDALRLIDGSDFSVFSARRPLFPGLLSVLLSLTGHNLMVSLAILTGIVGLACYFTTREMHQTHGPEVAVFVLMVLFLYYRAHSGVSMSENLGVALGALGFGLLWRAGMNQRLWMIWLGLLVTTLALNARAGAFFLLPLLILWAGWLLRGDKRVSWRSLVISSTAVILGFGLNLTLTRFLAVPSGVPFANFSYTLYGLSSGGHSWAYVFDAHPEVLALQEPEQSRRIYELAFELMREEPILTVKGALFNWKMLFSNTWYNVYSYIGGENWTVVIIARWMMYLLAVAGIYAWYRDPNDPVKSLVMISIVGVFISVPVLPPTDAYRMRPYAASIAILAALPAMGFHLLLEKTTRNPLGGREKDTASGPSTALFSMLLILITFSGPLLIKSTAQPIIRTPSQCPSALDTVLIRFDAGTYVNIRKQNLSFLDWMPDFHISLFQRNSHSLGDGNVIRWTDSVNPAQTIFLTLDHYSDRSVFVVIPTALLPGPGSTVQLCGDYDDSPEITEHRIFYAMEIRD